MKNLKRIISSFIAASMVYTSVFANFVYAADTNEDKMYIGAFIDKNSNYTIDKEQIGSTVNIDFDVINNPGIGSATFYVRYDPEVLRAKSGSIPENDKLESGGYLYYTLYDEELAMDVNYPPITNKTINDQLALVPSTDSNDYSGLSPDGVKTAAELGKIKIAFILPKSYVDEDNYLNDIKGDGHLFSMIFDVVGEGDANIYIETVKFGYKPVINGQLTIYRSIPTEKYQGKITVGSQNSSGEVTPSYDTVGDLDGDSLITHKDVKLLLKHLANIRTLTDEEFANADFDQNGEVNFFDIIELKKCSIWRPTRPWAGSVFGAGVGDITENNHPNHDIIEVDDSKEVRLKAKNTKGKVASNCDGIVMYFRKLDKDRDFTLTATAHIESYDASFNQTAFGLMLRDNMFWNTNYNTNAHCIAVGNTSQSSGKDLVCVWRRGTPTLPEDQIEYFDPNKNLIFEQIRVSAENPADNTNEYAQGMEVELKLEKKNGVYTLQYGNEEPVVAAVEEWANTDLTETDSNYVYAGVFAARSCDVTFKNINMQVY